MTLCNHGLVQAVGSHSYYLNSDWFVILKLPLQAECVRKRQYGYVESAALLAASGKQHHSRNKVKRKCLPKKELKDSKIVFRHLHFVQ